MAKWNRPEIEELGIEATEHNWTGNQRDGGYIGDGVISGHLSYPKPDEGSSNPGGSGDSDNENEQLS